MDPRPVSAPSTTLRPAAVAPGRSPSSMGPERDAKSASNGPTVTQVVMPECFDLAEHRPEPLGAQVELGLEWLEWLDGRQLDVLRVWHVAVVLLHRHAEH